MNKRSVHHFWRYSKLVPATALVVLFILSSVSAVFSLRGNNLKMLELRDEVIASDAANDGQTEKLLYELRDFINGHMNTSLRSGSFSISGQLPLQLAGSYTRAKDAESARVSAERQRIAEEAKIKCEAEFATSLLTRRAQCVQDYQSANPVVEKEIKKEFYTYDFASPSWSPDLAGWSLVVAAVSGVLMTLRFIVWYFVRRYLKQHI